MWVESSAPSNIALIKYMGKTDNVQNVPCNSSLSYTLEHLRTFVRIRLQADLTADRWTPYERADLRPIVLSKTGTDKFLNFFSKLKSEFNLSGFFEIQSANNFPSDCGLASSASSFAALTRAAYAWASEKENIKPYSAESLAQISKTGSGSSSRSFFSPWSEWSTTTITKIELPILQLRHQVILCDESIKSVSSSQAHRFVLTSDLFTGRPERAEARLKDLKEAFEKHNWSLAFQTCWNEFWDMHALFHTARPPFMYMNSGSQMVLAKILQLWQTELDGPLVTMDAGSNIHLLFRPNQSSEYLRYKKIFNSLYPMWTDEGYCAKF